MGREDSYVNGKAPHYVGNTHLEAGTVHWKDPRCMATTMGRADSLDQRPGSNMAGNETLDIGRPSLIPANHRAGSNSSRVRVRQMLDNIGHRFTDNG
jgi:hypothetical protein